MAKFFGTLVDGQLKIENIKLITEENLQVGKLDKSIEMEYKRRSKTMITEKIQMSPDQSITILFFKNSTVKYSLKRDDD